MKKGNLKILIIDDDEIFSEILKKLLEPYCKDIYACKTAENGSYYVSTHKPDLIFLDNQLPKLKGLEVLKLFKEFSPESKIILMSSHFNINDVSEAHRVKADHISNKKDISPAELEKLIMKVQKDESKKTSRWDFLGMGKSKKTRSQNGDIVIVEDDEMFMHNLKWVLNENGIKNKIADFNNIKDLFTYLKTNNPSLILLDYYLKNDTGKEVLDHLKTSRMETNVIILSSLTDTEIALDLNQYDILDFIVKDQKWQDRLSEVLAEFLNKESN
ncbi:MAG: response regulator [Cytophagales bacterium]